MTRKLAAVRPTHALWRGRLHAFVTAGIAGLSLMAGPSAASAAFQFGPPATYSALAPALDIATADLNGDGLPDVVVGTPEGIVILLNNGGSLASPVQYAFGVAKLVAAADFNGDGFPDVAFANTTIVGVLLNDGLGTFTSFSSYGAPENNVSATALVAFDFDRDDHVDLAFATVTFFGAGLPITIFRNRGDGTFAAALQIGYQGGSAIGADLNRDGYTDLITLGHSVLSVFINNRDGTFAPAVDHPGPEVDQVVAADLNGDGAPDLAIANGSHRLGVYLNKGDGTLGPLAVVPYFPLLGISRLAFSDFDGDGKLDLFAAQGNIAIQRGRGDGTFDDPEIIDPRTDLTGPIAVADIDGNGATDLIVNNPAASSIDVFLNQRLPPRNLLRLSTDHGGNAGSVTLTIFGKAIPAGSTTQLVCAAQPDIVGARATVSGDGSALTATFDLRGAVPGECSVVVTKPDATILTVPTPFTIEKGGAPQLWIQLLGFDRLRPGVPRPYMVVFGNRGNVDAEGVIVSVTAPTRSNITSLLSLEPPSLIPVVDFTQFPTSVDSGQEVIFPVAANAVPANSSSILPVRIAAPPDAGAGTTISIKGKIDYICSSGGPCELTTALDVLKLPVPFTSCLVNSFCAGYNAASAVINPAPWDNAIWSLIWVVITCGTVHAGPVPAFILAVFSYLVNCPGHLANADLDVHIVLALDPNEKFGATGVGVQRYVDSATPFRYLIAFENKETATAPAQEVSVSDQLDPIHLDLVSLSLGAISFGDRLITPQPFSKTFNAMVDLRPAQSLLVAINANLNASSGLLTWKLKALDPDTGLPPEDPTEGFLPPGGQGSVFFTVAAKPGQPTGTQIQNEASIVFDVNPPMATQTWLNTLDGDKPTSHVLPLPPTVSTPALTVSWSGADVGAGVEDYTVFVSDDGGPFTAFQTNTTATSALFGGQVDHTYAFYSISRDLVGNVESAKTTAEATTTVVAPTPTCSGDVSSQVMVARGGYRLNRALGAFVQTVTLKNNGAPLTKMALVLDGLSATATLKNASGATSCASPVGSPLLVVPGTLGTGQSATVTLQFTNPTNGAISYGTRVLAGEGAP